ncbi:MAG TPA: type II toxin-antitoxin system RelE/ParE family toxin [Rhizomicrobium sp.]|jgi:phage-related protein
MGSKEREVNRRRNTTEQPALGRPLFWIGSSKNDISQMPAPVKASFGYRLRRIQESKSAADIKALPQFGAGVFELRVAYDRNAYRVVYVLALKTAVYVLHAFMKKSKSGIGLPKTDVNLIQVRLKRAQELDAEKYHG